MRKERIKFRVLVPVILALLTILMGAVFGFYVYVQNQSDKIAQSLISRVQHTFYEELDKSAEVMNGVLDFLKEDKRLQNAWFTKDREKLLRYVSPIFEHIRSKYRITHFYFYELDRVCFLRVHNPPKYGDRIDRFTLARTVEKGEAVHGIELGRSGTLTLRMVYPWQVGGQLVGYIELGEEIEHVASHLTETIGVELILVIDKKNLDQTKWKEGMKMMERTGNWDQFPDFVVGYQTMDIGPSILQEYMKRSHHEHADLRFNIVDSGREYYAGFIPLIDVGERDIGDIIILNDVTKERVDMRILFAYLIGGAILIGGSLFIFYWFFLGRIEHRLVKSQNDLRIKIEEHKQAVLLLQREEKLLKNEVLQRKNAEAELKKQIANLAKAREATLNMMEDAEEARKKAEHINEMLKKEITERKKAEKELASKIKELEDFNRLAVDRELRMIELKEEINKLLAEHGMKQRYEIVR